MSTVLVVTGTGTGVGKTVVTAGLAALALAEGRRVAVLKPAQTGVADGQPGDLDEVRRLVGACDRLTLRELARYPAPLAPLTAATRAGRPPLDPAEAADAAAKLAVEHDLVLVEGAGGLLVRFTAGGTLADVAAALDAPVLVVTSAGLGTLNHTELTARALRALGLRCAGLVIGSWPARPDLAAECNLTDLPAVTNVPLVGAMPEGVGQAAPAEFLTTARSGLGFCMLAAVRARAAGFRPELLDLDDQTEPLNDDPPKEIGRHECGKGEAERARPGSAAMESG